jgi:hypothetical protein
MGEVSPRSQSVEEPSSPNRVSVLIDGRSVPLLPGPPAMDSARSPWAGLILERHQLGAVSIPEHEHAKFCLHLQSSELG